MLYSLKKRDIRQARKVLIDAFQHDPVWEKLFELESEKAVKFQAFFEVAARYCLKYGEVYAPSEKLEGIIGWVPGEKADMNVWAMINSGAIGAAMRIGLNVVKKLGPAFRPVFEDRRNYMAGQKYMYIEVVGVASEFQGRGLGRKLIGAAVEKANRERIHLYLETETEENVEMYRHFGFDLLKKITLPIIGLPMWEMVKKPDI